MRQQHLGIALSICLLTIACDLFTPKLHVVVRNSSGGDIDHAMLTFAGRDIPMGAIPSGAHASYGPIVTNIPSDATLSWQSADGHEHTQRVNVRSQVRENRSGDVMLTIAAADRVEVSFERLGD